MNDATTQRTAANDVSSAEFSKTVDSLIKQISNYNKQELEAGVNGTALILALGVSAVDLATAMVVSTNTPTKAMLNEVMESLISDMRHRANVAFAHYQNVAASTERSAA